MENFITFIQCWYIFSIVVYLFSILFVPVSERTVSTNGDYTAGILIAAIILAWSFSV